MKTGTLVKVVLGTGLVFLLGLLAVVGAGRFLQGLREELSSEEARQQFLSGWQPPLESTPQALFPDRLSGYARVEAPVDPAIPVTGYTGVQARYRGAGRAEVSVFAAAASDPEAEALFQRARDRFRELAGTRSVVEVPGRLRLSGGSPLETAEVWRVKGWLFYFRSEGEVDAGFIRAYLLAISGRSARQL